MHAARIAGVHNEGVSGQKTQEEEIITMRSIKVKLERSGVTLDGEVLGCAG